MKKIIIISLLSIFLGGCRTINRMLSKDNSPKQEQADILIFEGTTSSDYDSIPGIRMDNSAVDVTVEGNSLNKYEFTAAGGHVDFGHQVTLWANGNISYKVPYIPVAPKGSHYKITSSLLSTSKSLY